MKRRLLILVIAVTSFSVTAQTYSPTTVCTWKPTALQGEILTSADYSTPNTSLSYYGDCYTSVTVGVEVENACGTSGKTNTNIGTAPCGNFYSIVPNPVQDIITITTGDQTNMTAKSGPSSSSANSIAQIKIYNSNGVVVKLVQYNERKKQVQIDVADIAGGLYFIEVSNGNNRQTKKLLIVR